MTQHNFEYRLSNFKCGNKWEKMHVMNLIDIMPGKYRLVLKWHTRYPITLNRHDISKGYLLLTELSLNSLSGSNLLASHSLPYHPSLSATLYIPFNYIQNCYFLKRSDLWLREVGGGALSTEGSSGNQMKPVKRCKLPVIRLISTRNVT